MTETDWRMRGGVTVGLTQDDSCPDNPTSSTFLADWLHRLICFQHDFCVCVCFNPEAFNTIILIRIITMLKIFSKKIFYVATFIQPIKGSVWVIDGGLFCFMFIGSCHTSF